MLKRAVYLIPFVAVACTQDRKPDKAADAPAPAAIVTNSPADTAEPALPRDTTYSQERLNQDSLYQAIIAFEQRLAAAPAGDSAALLFALGKAKSNFTPPNTRMLRLYHKGDSAQINYAASRSNEFVDNEVGGNFIYTGSDFRTLIDRYPTHELVDDAAWAMTLLPIRGECEGWIACYIDRAWERLGSFLAGYSTSPLAKRALSDAIMIFEESLKEYPDLTAASDDRYDTKQVRTLVASFDSVARLLPPEMQARALITAGKLWRRLHDVARARSAFEQALSTSTDEAQRKRIRFHLENLRQSINTSAS